MLPNNEIKNRWLRREQFIIQLVLDISESQNQKDSATLFFKDLRRNEFFTDNDTLDITLNNLRGKFGKDPYRISYRSAPGSMLAAGGNNGGGIPYSIKIFIEDVAKLSTYLIELEQKLNKDEIAYKFILDDKNLYLDGSEVRPYTMKLNSLKYQILHNLVKEKKLPPIF